MASFLKPYFSNSILHRNSYQKISFFLLSLLLSCNCPCLLDVARVLGRLEMSRINFKKFCSLSPALAAKYLAQTRVETALFLTTHICVDNCNYVWTPLMCSDICWDFINKKKSFGQISVLRNRETKVPPLVDVGTVFVISSSCYWWGCCWW